MRKPDFCICEKKDADQQCGSDLCGDSTDVCAVNAQMISAFVFAT